MKLFENANWIWSGDFEPVNSYVTFYDKLDICKMSGCYKLYISVDTDYSVSVNGQRAAFGQYADYPFDKVYDELDITELLHEGENDLVIECWHQGEDTSTRRGERAGLIYVLADTDSNEILAKSSEKTLCAPDPHYRSGDKVEFISGQLGRTFYYDSTRRSSDFRYPASVTEKPLPTRARPIKKLMLGDDEPAYLTVHGSFKNDVNRRGTIGQRMQYAALTFAEPNVKTKLPSDDGVQLYCDESADGIFAMIDTGRENAGILSLDIDVPSEAEILIGWGEHLEDMRVRSFVGGRNFCASYTARAGRNTFVHPFRRLGMRYLQLHICAPTATLYYAGIKRTDYPLSENISFSCADSLHTRIYEVCKRTLLMSMHEHYEDCPWREQALYTMDSRNQMLCGYYAFREFDFAKASIRLMGQSIRDDNMLELCSPARVSITIPSFSAIYLTQVYEYLKYSGDREFVTSVLPYMKRIADEFLRRTENERGLLRCFTEAQYWNFYEWQDGLSGSISGSISEEAATYDAPLCAFVSFGLRSLANVYEELGEATLSEYYRDAHLKLNEAIDRYFWDEEKGAYASYIDNSGKRSHYAELTNSLIVYADAASNEHLSRTLENLKNERLLGVTLSHSIFKYEALMREPELYARYVFGDIARQWGYMLSKDATTFWETIKGAADFGNAGSLCHGWSAIPIYFYHKYALEMSGETTGIYETRVYEDKTDKLYRNEEIV